MMNKRGDGRGVPMEVLVFWIVLVILLIVIIISMFKLPWIYDKIGAYFDSLLIVIGLKTAGTGGTTTPDCSQLPASFVLNNGVTDEVMLELCFKWNEKTCRVFGFDDKAEYMYNADKGTFSKKLNDTGWFPVNLNKEYTDADYKNKVFYNSIKLVYDAMGVPPEYGRVLRYDFDGYIKYNIDDYFGRFGNMVVMYAEGPRYYLMGASGRYLVVDLDVLEDNGLSWIDEWFVDYDKNVNSRLITPITGTFINEAGYVYAGTSVSDAVRKFYEAADEWVDDPVSYAICSPVDSNSVYENCKYTRKNVVDSGSFTKFIDVAYEALDRRYPKDTDDTNEFDSEMDYVLVRNYFQQQEKLDESSSTGFSNPATKFNELLASKGMGTFVVDGKTFIAEARASNDPKYRYPVLRVRTEDNSEVYYLRFEGPDLYRDGQTDFFFSKGNQIRPPFIFYDKDMKKIEVSREFTQTADEDALDRQVYDYVMERCA